MVQAGASGINWIALLTEWTPDYTSTERQAVYPGLLERGGGVGLSVEYLLANAPVPAAQRVSADPEAPGALASSLSPQR